RRERPARRSRKNRGRPPLLLGLAPGGVCPAAAVAGGAVRSYRTISPLPPRKGTKPLKGLAVCFCGTFPRVAPAGRYPAPCFRGARTFLSPPCGEKRPSGRLAGSIRVCAAAMSNTAGENGDAAPRLIIGNAIAACRPEMPLKRRNDRLCRRIERVRNRAVI